MSELIRVFRRKTVFILLIIAVLNTCIFMYSFPADSSISLSGYQLDKYIAEYENFQDKITENSKSVNILMSYGSRFEAEKNQKLIEKYSELSDTHAVKGENTGTEAFIQYRISDIAVLLFMIVIAVDFQKERKKGLVNMIRATLHGRGRLFLYRLFVLAFAVVVSSVLVYGGCLMAAYLIFGNPELSRSLQSLPEFMECPYRITIGEFLLEMTAVKMVTIYLITLIFYILISVLGTGLTYAVMTAAAAAELILYKVTGVLASFNHLRYINFYTMLKFDNYYNECYYLNIFDQAVPVLHAISAVLLILLAVSVTAGYIIHGRKYVSSLRASAAVTDFTAGIAEKLALQKTMCGWEVFKLYIRQGGIVFAAGAFAAVSVLASNYRYVYQPDWDSVFMQQKMDGEITQEKLDYINDWQEKWHKSRDINTERIYDLCQKKMTAAVGSALSSAEYSLYRAEEGIEICDETEKNLISALEYTERTGKKLNFIKPYAYEFLLRDDVNSTGRASLIILIGIIGSVSGIYAFDRQNNMRNSIRALYRGRLRNTAARIIPVCLICALLCVSVHLIQFYSINGIMKFENMNEPVQALMIKRDFPLDITIKQYLILLFAVRAAAAAGIGLICCLISRFSPDTATAAGICIFVLAVPSVIAQIVPDAGIVNAVSLLSGAGI